VLIVFLDVKAKSFFGKTYLEIFSEIIEKLYLKVYPVLDLLSL